MGIGEAGRIAVGEAVGVLLLQRQRLVDGQVVVDVDVARKQVGLQRGGVGDQAHRHLLEARRGTRPVRVGGQGDGAAGLVAAHHERAVPQAGVERVAVVLRGVDVLAGTVGALIDRPLDVLGQQLVPLRKGAEHAVQVEHRGVVVHHVHAARPGPGVGVAEPGVRVAPNAPGERHVPRRDRHAVAPAQLRPQLEGDGHARALLARQAVLQRRDFRAEQADQRVAGVVGGHGAGSEAQHVVLDEQRVDGRVQAGRELGNADHQGVSRLRGGLEQQGGREGGESEAKHGACLHRPAIHGTRPGRRQNGGGASRFVG